MPAIRPGVGSPMGLMHAGTCASRVVQATLVPNTSISTCAVRTAHERVPIVRRLHLPNLDRRFRIHQGVLMHHRVIALLFVASWIALPASAQDKAPASAERVNSALAPLDAYIRASLERTKVPGVAVAVIYDDKVIFLRGYGVRKAGESTPVDPDTVFEIASFSKPIASTILASLVGKGRISWDDRIADLEPGFQLSSAETTRQITIRDFLSHRSGLATESGDLLEDLGYSRPQILYRMRYLPLPGQFRRTYAYSNFGYTTGSIAAATKIGKPWET